MALPAPHRDTTVLVTGASSGIGEALARELASRGHNVTIAARRRRRLDALARELRAEHGVTVDVRRCDLAADDDRLRLVERLLRGRRRLVGVCNNAGEWTMGPIAEADVDAELAIVRLNAVAVHELTVRLLGALLEAGAGAILNVASVNGFQPLPNNATYAATKAFVISLSEALHAELAGTGVSCTVINPGPTRTEVFEHAGTPDLELPGMALIWQESDAVAREAVDAMESGARAVTPGLPNQLVELVGRFTPRTVLLPVARQLLALLR